MAEIKRYVLKKKTIPIEIEQPDGQVRQCELRELSGAERNAYLNVQSRKVVQKGDGTGQVKDFTGMCSDLLCRCLYDDAGTAIAANIIDTWPSEMQLELFKEAQRLSGLSNEGELEAKKD